MPNEDETKPTVWAYGNGMPGCLFDNISSGFCSPEGAAAAASEMLELTEAEHEELQQDHILYLHGDRVHEVGASLVQLFEDDNYDPESES